MTAPLLEAQALALTRGGGMPLGPLDLTLRPGARVAILGAEASGKSLLLRLLAGLAPPDAGEIRLEGRPLGAWSAPERAARLGVLFQEVDRQWLMPQVWDDVALGLTRLGLHQEESARRVEHALNQAGLPPALHRAAFTSLAPSQRCRAAVAALLAPRPRLILADEPGHPLSQEGEEALARRLHDYCQEENAALLLFTSRRERAERFASTLLLLHQGVLRPASEPLERSAP